MAILSLNVLLCLKQLSKEKVVMYNEVSLGAGDSVRVSILTKINYNDLL